METKAAKAKGASATIVARKGNSLAALLPHPYQKWVVMKRLVLIIILLVLQVLAPKPSHPESEVFEALENQVYYSIKNSVLWDAYYNETLEYIKKHEGFAGGRPYVCAAGHATIGYGHVIQPGENFPERITRQQGEQLLRNDFNRVLRYVDANIQLDGAQKLAVAHFVFALGIGKFNRSKLKLAIEQGHNVDTLWLDYSHYHTPEGRRIKSQVALKLRQWELDMFKR